MPHPIRFCNAKHLARSLAATKFEIRMSKYETNPNDKKSNTPNLWRRTAVRLYFLGNSISLTIKKLTTECNIYTRKCHI